MEKQEEKPSTAEPPKTPEKMDQSMPAKKGYQLYIGKLALHLTESDLEKEFAKFGPHGQFSLKKGFAFIVPPFV